MWSYYKRTKRKAQGIPGNIPEKPGGYAKKQAADRKYSVRRLAGLLLRLLLAVGGDGGHHGLLPLHQGVHLVQGLARLLQLAGGMGHGGCPLGPQGLVFQTDLIGPLGHLLMELTHLVLGLVLDQLGPAVGVQLQPGGPLFQGGIGLGIGL